MLERRSLAEEKHRKHLQWSNKQRVEFNMLLDHEGKGRNLEEWLAGVNEKIELIASINRRASRPFVIPGDYWELDEYSVKNQTCVISRRVSAKKAMNKLRALAADVERTHLLNEFVDYTAIRK